MQIDFEALRKVSDRNKGKITNALDKLNANLQAQRQLSLQEQAQASKDKYQQDSLKLQEDQLKEDNKFKDRQIKISEAQNQILVDIHDKFGEKKEQANLDLINEKIQNFGNQLKLQREQLDLEWYKTEETLGLTEKQIAAGLYNDEENRKVSIFGITSQQEHEKNMKNADYIHATEMFHKEHLSNSNLSHQDFLQKLRVAAGGYDSMEDFMRMTTDLQKELQMHKVLSEKGADLFVADWARKQGIKTDKKESEYDKINAGVFGKMLEKANDLNISIPDYDIDDPKSRTVVVDHIAKYSSIHNAGENLASTGGAILDDSRVQGLYGTGGAQPADPTLGAVTSEDVTRLTDWFTLGIVQQHPDMTQKTSQIAIEEAIQLRNIGMINAGENPNSIPVEELYKRFDVFKRGMVTADAFMKPDAYQTYMQNQASIATKAYENLITNNPAYTTAKGSMNVVSQAAYDLMYLPGHSADSPNTNDDVAKFIANMGDAGNIIAQLRNNLSQNQDQESTTNTFKAMTEPQRDQNLKQLDVIQAGLNGKGEWGPILSQLKNEDSASANQVEAFINSVKIGIQNTYEIEDYENQYNKILINSSDPFLEYTIQQDKVWKANFQKSRIVGLFDNIITNNIVNLSSQGPGKSGNLMAGMDIIKSWPLDKGFEDWSEDELSSFKTFNQKAMLDVKKLFMADKGLMDMSLSPKEISEMILSEIRIAQHKQ